MLLAKMCDYAVITYCLAAVAAARCIEAFGRGEENLLLYQNGEERILKLL